MEEKVLKEYKNIEGEVELGTKDKEISKDENENKERERTERIRQERPDSATASDEEIKRKI